MDPSQASRVKAPCICSRPRLLRGNENARSRLMESLLVIQITLLTTLVHLERLIEHLKTLTAIFAPASASPLAPLPIEMVTTGDEKR
jgi:hypothetical protein